MACFECRVRRAARGPRWVEHAGAARVAVAGLRAASDAATFCWSDC